MIGILLVALTLFSCSAEVPEETTEPKPDVVEEEAPQGSSQPPGKPSGSGCDLYGTTVHVVNGMEIPVPVECNEYYFDKGDPPPDEKLNPAQQFVNEV